MPVTGRSQEERCRIDRPARDDHKVRRIRLLGSVVIDDDAGDLPARTVCLETFDEGTSFQMDIGMPERRLDTEDLGVGLAVDQAGKAVECVTADAATGVRRPSVAL